MKNLTNPPQITTQLIAYRYDLDNDAEREEYKALCNKLGVDRKLMDCGSMNDSTSKLTTGTVTLDAGCVFDNQWNTADDSPVNASCRVFDWYESIKPNRRIKVGHYLELTDEIHQLRKDVHKCGYCGAHHWASEGLAFCDQCIGSSYLDEAQIYLLRLVPVTCEKRDPLTDVEREVLMPAYITAQTEGTATEAGEALTKKRDELRTEYEGSIAEAKAKFAGFTWLMDANINTHNCIYYDHLKQFCFGWRESIGESVRDALTTKLENFPYNYVIK